MDNIQLAYIAGFIDGEGCITINANGSLCLGIVNTSLPVLNHIRNVLGVGVVQSRKQRVNKAQYVYRAYGDDCELVLEALKDFLIEKKDQALTALEYRNKSRTEYVRNVLGRRGAVKNPYRDEYRERLTAMKTTEYKNHVN